MVNTFGLVKQAHHQKKVYCEVSNCKQTVKYLRVLRQNALIYGYTVIPNTDKILVYLRYYRNKPTLKHIQLISKPGHRRSLSHKNYFFYTTKFNPGNVAVVSNPKTSDIESCYLSKYSKEYQYINKNFGEFLSIVW